MRIVSLLPSATEMLCLIGGERLLVGRSHECDFPDSISHLPILTDQLVSQTTPPSTAPSPSAIDRQVSKALSSGASLYRLDEDRLHALAPDLILTQDLCEVCSIDLRTVERVSLAMSPRPAIVSLNPESFEDVLDDLMTIGRAASLELEAQSALVALRERFFRAADFVNPYADQPRVVFLEWCDPPYVAGHWTPQLIERAGARHPLNETAPMENAGAGAGGQMAHRLAGKSIRVDPAVISAVDPDYVIVCPCGVKLGDVPAHLASIEDEPWWRSLRAVQNGRVALVDGNEMFNRPGPRLVDAYEWLVGWLNDRPEVIPAGIPWIRHSE